MKRTLLFFILFISTLMGAMEYPGPFKDFVSRCRDSKLSERVSEYRAKFDDLLKQGKMYLKEPAAYELMREIASQGDFESLDLLERDLAPNLKNAVWEGVSNNSNTDDAKKLLLKWAKENPTVPLLMRYHPRGVDLMIEMAEDKKVRMEYRVQCLEMLASMPAAIKVLDRIKALMSDQSEYYEHISPDIRYEFYPQTLGTYAAETVKEIERRKLQEK
jgi:hypothetical protein